MRLTTLLLVMLAVGLGTPVAAAAEPCTELPCPADPAAVDRVLASAAEREWVEVLEIGRSAGGRPLRVVHVVGSAGKDPVWRLLLVGQQHGDEPAGKDALLHLIRRMSEDRAAVPPGLELWIVPVANPDGAAADRRRNDAAADLNRDHLLLAQPETRALHQLARDVRPHVIVDCHEFNRTSPDYRDRGWIEWPLIMMDTANHPLLPDAVYRTGVDWIEAAALTMAEAGIPYARYTVGEAPPDGELRPSTLEADDARNGLALATGALGFIIESGIRQAAADPQADIARRVQAYLVLLERFFEDSDLRAESLAAVEEARSRRAPRFLPVNTLWGSVGVNVATVVVVDATTGAPLEVETPNLMDQRIVKHSVVTPPGYLVDAPAAETFRPLLARHAIPYEVLPREASRVAQQCVLERIEDTYDTVYNRYEGRQIVRCGEPSEMTFAAGSLMVQLDGPHWRSAAVLLEPMQLYGLYEHDEVRAMVAEDGTIPVYRLVE